MNIKPKEGLENIIRKSNELIQNSQDHLVSSSDPIEEVRLKHIIMDKTSFIREQFVAYIRLFEGIDANIPKDIREIAGLFDIDLPTQKTLVNDESVKGLRVNSNIQNKSDPSISKSFGKRPQKPRIPVPDPQEPKQRQEFSFKVWYRKLNNTQRITLIGFIIPAITTILVTFITVSVPIMIEFFSDQQTSRTIITTSTSTFTPSQSSNLIATINPFSTNTPTITPVPTSISTKIIITDITGNRTSYECPVSTAPAILNIDEVIRLELSAAMPEEDFGKLEWSVLISGSNKRFFIGKTASYTLTQGGVFYVKLVNVTICTLKFQVSTP